MIHDIEKLNSQYILTKKAVRKRLKIQKKIHRSSVQVQKKKLQFMLSKQKETAYRQIEMKQAVIIPLILNTKKGLKARKIRRRIIELNTGKNIFSYSTLPSSEFLDKSLRHSIKTSSNLSKKMEKCYEYTLVPDLNFADLFVISQKPFSKNPEGAPLVCRTEKEVPKKQLAVMPKHHVSGPLVRLRSRLRNSKQVK